MTKIINERLNRITALLADRNAIHLKELAEQLAISEITVRRNVQENRIGLKIVGGYVIKDDSYSQNAFNGTVKGVGYSLITESHKLVNEKRHIGNIAVDLIMDGDIVFIDGGSTTPFIAEFIPKSLFCTVICYSFSTLALLKQKPNCEIIMLGGRYNRNNQNFYGIASDNLLSDMRISKSFISCTGMSLEFGVMDSDRESIAIKKKVMSVSQKCYLAADTSKIDRVGAAFFADLKQFDALITNKYSSDNSKLESMKKEGLRVFS